MRNWKCRLLGGCAIIGAVAPAGTAIAQEVNANSGGNDTIIVTAQFREQNLQQTPLAITAISGDLL